VVTGKDRHRAGSSAVLLTHHSAVPLVGLGQRAPGVALPIPRQHQSLVAAGPPSSANFRAWRFRWGTDAR